jgi:predicted Rossmann fold nucleotide-binding protein DprA/Smf involved in DNA uptake
MNDGLSADTQAVLLLCGRLGQIENNEVKPLTPKQYGVVARWLRERSMRPADLLDAQGLKELAGSQIPGIQQEIVVALLDRGAALGMMAERWASRGLWVLSRGDEQYPTRFKSYLSHGAPPLLFGAGNQELLQSGGLAMVGSRDVSGEDIEYARRVAAACASQGIAVISGGARGVDLESMATAFEAGGVAVGILPDSLGRNAVSARYREGLMAGRLALVSPYEPEARWFAFTAMERNKLIYALSDAALVVAAAAESGGTWTGAVEALEYGRVMVYVKAAGATLEGNRRLLARGAQPFPDQPWADLRSLFVPVAREALLFRPAPESARPSTEPEPPPVTAALGCTSPAPPRAAETEVSTANALDAFARVLPTLLAALTTPRTPQDIEESLRLVPAQAKAWLKRAYDEGRVRKLSHPVRYVAVQDTPSLFGNPGGNTRESEGDLTAA